MKELIHKDCGGEIHVVSVYTTERFESVEFRCIKCNKGFYYEQGGDY